MGTRAIGRGGGRGKGARVRPPTGLADVLFTATQQRVLGLFFGQPERSFTQRELIQLAASGSGAVQRELARLVKSGLVVSATIGAQSQYRANPSAPIFEELRSIIEKTVGVAGQVRGALASLSDHISLALLYGSLARGGDTARSDIDVLVVSDDLTLEEVFAALGSAEERLGRHVAPTLYTTTEFRRRRREKHPFLTKVLSGKHLVLFGSEDAVEAPGQSRKHRAAED